MSSVAISGISFGVEPLSPLTVSSGPFKFWAFSSTEEMSEVFSFLSGMTSFPDAVLLAEEFDELLELDD